MKYGFGENNSSPFYHCYLIRNVNLTVMLSLFRGSPHSLMPRTEPFFPFFPRGGISHILFFVFNEWVPLSYNLPYFHLSLCLNLILTTKTTLTYILPVKHHQILVQSRFCGERGEIWNLTREKCDISRGVISINKLSTQICIQKCGVWAKYHRFWQIRSVSKSNTTYFGQTPQILVHESGGQGCSENTQTNLGKYAFFGDIQSAPEGGKGPPTRGPQNF